MNELDDMLLRIDQEEALIAAFDEHRPELLAYFDAALAALHEGPIDADDRRLALAHDHLRAGKAVAEADYIFRIALLLGAHLERGIALDYHAVAAVASSSLDERLGTPRHDRRPI